MRETGEGLVIEILPHPKRNLYIKKRVRHSCQTGASQFIFWITKNVKVIFEGRFARENIYVYLFIKRGTSIQYALIFLYLRLKSDGVK